MSQRPSGCRRSTATESPLRFNGLSVGSDASHAPRGEAQGNVLRLNHLMAQEREVSFRGNEAGEHGLQRGCP